MDEGHGAAIMPDVTEPVAIISPHLDDAVFGCGQLLATRPGSIVITVFAGAPPEYAEPTEWDALAGFRAGEDVLATRRAEDRRALAALGACPVWLDFCDSQYHRTPTVAAVAAALDAALARAALPAVFIPLGLFHSDHHLTHAAAISVLRRRPEMAWYAYEEAMYRRVADSVAGRIAALREARIEPVFAGTSSERGRGEKERAIGAYASQLRALAAPKKPGYADAFATERYWSLRLRVTTAKGAEDAA